MFKIAHWYLWTQANTLHAVQNNVCEAVVKCATGNFVGSCLV